MWGWLDAVWTWAGGRWDFFFALTASAWAAVANWATFAVAVVAARFAFGQVREARISRDETAQPNVVVYTEPVNGSWQFLDIAIKNFGQTPAFDVKVKLDSLPEVSPDHSGAGVTNVAIPECIPVLAPGQEWRGLWDFAPAHFETEGIKHKHEGSVEYREERKRRAHWYSPKKTERTHSTPVLLDFNLLANSRRVRTKTIDDVADTLATELKAMNVGLAAIASDLDGFSDEHHGVWIYPTDAEAERQRRVEAKSDRAAHLVHLRRVRDQLLGIATTDVDETSATSAATEGSPPSEPTAEPEPPPAS